MFTEFKKFAMRGNVLDMAVGIIIGAAFSPIVKALVDGILMPPIGLLLGDVDFSDLFLVLKEGEAAGPYASLQAAQEAGAVTIDYGVFVNNVVTFLIVAFAVFLFVKVINRWKDDEEAPAPAPTTRPCPFCVTDVSLQATRCPACTSDLSGS